MLFHLFLGAAVVVLVAAEFVVTAAAVASFF